MQDLITKLTADFPHLRFVAGKSFCWSPATNEVFYRKAARASQADKWSLLHEVSHAKLGHEKLRNRPRTRPSRGLRLGYRL